MEGRKEDEDGRIGGEKLGQERNGMGKSGGSGGYRIDNPTLKFKNPKVLIFPNDRMTHSRKEGVLNEKNGGDGIVSADDLTRKIVGPCSKTMELVSGLVGWLGRKVGR